MNPTPQTDPLQAALDYAARGWPVHPCIAGDKRPMLADWPTRASTDAVSVRQWFADGAANVGIVTGERSGVWVLDIDGPAGVADLDRLEAAHGTLPPTRVVTTPGGGGHYYWRMPDGIDLRNRTGIGGMAIDVRGTGGYVVAPPSRTAKGVYSVATDLPVADAPGWLIEFVTRREKIAPPPPPDDRLPFRHTTGADAYARAGSYLDGTPGAVSGQRGHDATFAAARACYTGFALDVEQTYRLLRDRFNPRCVPPWNDGELRHKAQSAADTPSRYERGYLRDAERNGDQRGAGTTGVPTAGQTAVPARPRFEFIDSTTFAGGDYRASWLVKNVLTRGEPAGIGGPMKSLKTSIAVDLAISVATGTPFVGHFGVPHAVTTAIVSGESGRSTLQKVAERVCEAKGITLESVDTRLHWCTDVPRLDDVPGMAIFADELVKRGVEFVLCDPLFMMLGDTNAASIFEAGSLLRNVGTMLVSKGVTPAFLHHARKVLEPGKPMELSDLSHAGFAEFVRQFLLLNREESYRGDGRHKLICRIGGSAGHGGEYLIDVEEGTLQEDFSGRYWRVNVTNKADVPKATAEDRDTKKNEANRAKMKSKIDKFMADLDTELSNGAPAVTANKLKTGYAWQHAEIKTISESLLIDGTIELHDFTFRAGQGATQTATGFRRPVVRTQANIPFAEQPVGNEQPVFSDAQPVQPAVPGEGGEHTPEQPVGLSPLKGDNHGEPAVVRHPDENRKIETPKIEKTGRQKKPAVRRKRKAAKS